MMPLATDTSTGITGGNAQRGAGQPTTPPRSRAVPLRDRVAVLHSALEGWPADVGHLSSYFPNDPDRHLTCGPAELVSDELSDNHPRTWLDFPELSRSEGGGTAAKYRNRGAQVTTGPHTTCGVPEVGLCL